MSLLVFWRNDPEYLNKHLTNISMLLLFDSTVVLKSLDLSQRRASMEGHGTGCGEISEIRRAPGVCST